MQEAAESLTSLCSFQEIAPKNIRIVLTDNTLFLFAPSQLPLTEALPQSYLELSFDLTFERMLALPHQQGESPLFQGFKIIDCKGKELRIFIQFAELAKLWVKFMSKRVIELNFHKYFKMIRKLGKGCSATVLEVERIEDGALFAAKAISKEYYMSKEERTRSIQSEIEMMRCLEDERVVGLEAVFISENTLYIVMENMKGRNLYERINSSMGFSLEETKVIMHQIVSGLQYLHKYDVMHRDIKLENIMFRQKDSLNLALADFGLAACT